MTPSFKHYLVTRYNIPITEWERDKQGQPTTDEDWLAHREKIFRTICLPSVKGQTQNNFTWILYFDVNTPALFLESLQKELSALQAEIRLVKDFPSCLEDLKKTLSTADTPYVITSRLDNDDGLARDYIEKVQHAFIPQDKTIISFGKGLIYDQHQSVLTKSGHYWKNHFTSLIEQPVAPDDLLTVIGFPHDNPPPMNTVRINDTGWIKLIHDRNIKSRLFGRPVPFYHVAKHFNLDPEAFPVSLPQTWWYAARKTVTVFYNTMKRIVKR